MARPKGSKNAVRTKKTNVDYAAIVAEKTILPRDKLKLRSLRCLTTSCLLYTSYGEAVIHLPSTYRSFPQWEIIAFVTDVAHHHRNVTEECVFNFQGAG